ncbi:MAG: hypothetical protein HGA75_01865 [Thiobacillus sp.]|nr:hypothetical protein [Thiobacillus sp.]
MIDTLRRLILLSSCLLLASCGGSFTTAGGGVGTGGTGIGTVTGFGSLIIDGNTYSSATAEYWEGNEQEESAQVSALSVALGQQVQILTDDQGNPTTVVVEPTLIGTAQNVTASTLTVNGVAVRVNGNPLAGPVTYYAGLSGMAALADGMKVEVHGLYGVGADGPYVLATRIAQLPSTSMATRITGVVANLNPGAGTFRIGSMTILYGGATKLPPGVTLANGQLVNVWSPNAPVGGQLSAEAIRIRSLYGITDSAIVAGLVSDLAGSQFRVSGIAVDASAVGLAATVQSLRQGDYVVVGGQVDTGTDRLIATSIRTTATTAVELKGTVTEFVSAGNFLVRGVAVDATSATIAGGALANGAYVEVHGQVQGNTVVASAVEVHASTPENATVEFDGTVSARNGNNFVLTLPDGTPYSATLATNVAYENGTASQLVNGARIEVEATWTSTGLVVYGVEFKSLDAPAGSDVYETGGIAYDVNLPTSFAINGLTIQINGKDATGLANGVEVEVHFTYEGGQYLAQEIEVDN